MTGKRAEPRAGQKKTSYPDRLPALKLHPIPQAWICSKKLP